MAAHRIRLAIADDSGFMRRLLGNELEARGFDVVALAEHGDAALEACRLHRPDVLSLDLAMPGLDGIGVLRALREADSPTPVVVVSAFSPAQGARAVDALSEGAVDLVAKPAVGVPLDTFFDELVAKLTGAAASSVRRVRPAGGVAAARRAVPVRRATAQKRAVVIACSTGGPRALAALTPSLRSPLGSGTLIVQHMPPGFTGSLADRLNRASRLTVREAQTGDELDPGTVLIAPGGSHLRLGAGARAQLSDAPPIGGLRPRADLTIADAAKIYGDRLLLVVLTGMGKDGLEGAQEVRRRGGRILVEAESTCTVYGMPRAVVEANLADEILTLDALPEAIMAEAGA